jgi:hypothetical protein
MADIQNSIYQYLQTVSAVTGICSTRVYFNVADEGTDLPFVLLEQVQEDQPHQFAAVPTMREPRLRLTSYAASIDGAKALDGAIYTALMGAAASLPLITCQAVYFEGCSHDYDDAARLHSVDTEYRFHVNI